MMEKPVPQARYWAIPLIVSAVLFTWALTRTEPTTFALVVLAVASGFAVWCVFNWLEWMFDRFGEQRRLNREVEFKFTENFKLETVARMSETQIKAVRAGRQIIEILPGERGPVEKLAGVECYLYTAWYILVNSTDLNVYPINRFQTGTFHFDVLGDMAVDDHRQAKNFHHWLYSHGYAMWGRGNTSMSWNEGWNRERVMETLGLDENTYSDG